MIAAQGISPYTTAIKMRFEQELMGHLEQHPDHREIIWDLAENDARPGYMNAGLVQVREIAMEGELKLWKGDLSKRREHRYQMLRKKWHRFDEDESWSGGDIQ